VYVRRRQKHRSPEAIAEARSRKNSPQMRALDEEERAAVRATLYSEEYADHPPAEVHVRLLEQGEAPCSVSTMHRLLREDRASGERRPQRPAQHHAMPHLLAVAPNEVWTWDITKLPTVQRGVYLSLYVIMDLFSRFVVKCMVSHKETAALAQQVLQSALDAYGIAPGSLTLHQDRGAPMTAHCFLDLMAELGVGCSHSRPRVSNDNAMSESQFKTLKQQPDYPGRFASIEHARRWSDDYFAWYNNEHHHSGLAYYTPAQVYTGQVEEMAQRRQAALDKQYELHPERFVHGRPVTPLPPERVTINPINLCGPLLDPAEGYNQPTLPRAQAGNSLS
jgi:putative transposase